MMELGLLRHGIAADHAASGRDYDRPLTELGIARTTAVCAILAERFQHDVIWSSLFVRAKHTADIAAAAWNCEVRVAPWFASGASSMATLISEIAALDQPHASDEPASPLLVGHEPECGLIVDQLSGQRCQGIRKAGYARLHGAVHDPAMHLEALLRPRDLIVTD